MFDSRRDRRRAKLAAFAAPFLEADEHIVASLPYAMEVVPFKFQFLIGPLAQLMNKQYALVVTERRLLVIRANLLGTRRLDATYPRLSVAAGFDKGRFWGALRLSLPGQKAVKLQVHPVSAPNAREVAAALPPMVATPT